MTLTKIEYIEKYGADAWRARLDRQNKRRRELRQENLESARANDKNIREKYPEQIKERNRNWYVNNPEKVEERQHERSRKGGRLYNQKLNYNKTGLQKLKLNIRHRHGTQYRPYKRIIAPDSQIHHEWIPKTAEYRGLALVEKNPHQYGIIDVIQILDGKITLLTEEEIQNQEPTIDIPHEEALALIQEIQTKKNKLGMEMVEWIDWSEEVVGMLSDLFDITEKELCYK